MKQTKLLLFFTIAIFAGNITNAQTKFGDNKTTIQPGSLLELESTNKGLLLPRLTTTQMNSIPVTAASNGMTVYNTDSACICQYTGTAWKSLCSAYQEPWNDKITKTGATLNTQDIYQMGRVHVGTDYTDLFEAFQPKTAIQGKKDNINSLFVYDTLSANSPVPKAALAVNALFLNTNNAASGSDLLVSASENVINGITPFNTNAPFSASVNNALNIQGAINNDFVTQGNNADLRTLTVNNAGGISSLLQTSNGTSISGNEIGFRTEVKNTNTPAALNTTLGIDNYVNNLDNTSITANAYGIRSSLNNSTSGTVKNVSGIENNITNIATTTVPGATYGTHTLLTNHTNANGGGVYGDYTSLVVDGASSTQTGFFQPGIVGNTSTVTVSNGGGDATANRNAINVTAGTRQNVYANDNTATYTGTTDLNKLAGIQSSTTFNSDAAELNPTSNAFRYFGGLYGFNNSTAIIGAGPITNGANIVGIRNSVTSARTASISEPIIGFRNEVFTGPQASASAEHNMGIGTSVYVGRFNGSPVYFDSAYANTVSANGNNIAAGYVVGDFKGNLFGPSVSANLATGTSYGFAVTTASLYSAGGRKTFAFYAQDARDANAFIGNTGIGTETPQRKLHIVPAAGAATSIRIEGVPQYTDNTAAVAAGLVPGDVYRNGDDLKIVH